MMIAPRVSLVEFFVDGIRAVLNRDEAKELKLIHKNAVIKPLRKGRSSIRDCEKPSTVRIMSADEYMKSCV